MVEGGTIETRDTSSGISDPDGSPLPGVVLIFVADRPTMVSAALSDDRRFVVGRGAFAGALEDGRASREHAAVCARDGAFEVTDAGSRNGTFLDGVRIDGAKAVRAAAGSILRVGQSLVLFAADVRPFERPKHDPAAGDVVIGPTLAAAHARIARAGSVSGVALLHGESGSGKELAARVFHEATGRAGPLVAVNCAAIPAGVAERLLFGAKRGAYSGADVDADGYMQSAHGGTLFLDEVAELDLAVQAKLLRAIETQEVLALGASRPRKVDLRVCSATHKDLRGEVAKGTFRQDLYFRLGQPELDVPPLRARREEIPWLLAREVAKASRELQLHAGFVEACLLRAWPGNVRELLGEARRAAHEALARGGEPLVKATDLAANAGRAIAPITTPPAPPPLVVNERSAGPDDARIRDVLAAHDGNVTAAAKALGMHRTQLRRWVTRQRG